jgi:hypothetical protein
MRSPGKAASFLMAIGGVTLNQAAHAQSGPGVNLDSFAIRSNDKGYMMAAPDVTLWIDRQDGNLRVIVSTGYNICKSHDHGATGQYVWLTRPVGGDDNPSHWQVTGMGEPKPIDPELMNRLDEALKATTLNWTAFIPGDRAGNPFQIVPPALDAAARRLLDNTDNCNPRNDKMSSYETLRSGRLAYTAHPGLNYTIRPG